LIRAYSARGGRTFAAPQHPHGGLRGWVSQGSVVLRFRLANIGDFQGKAGLHGRLAESVGDSKGLIVTLGHVLRRVHHRCVRLGRSTDEALPRALPEPNQGNDILGALVDRSDAYFRMGLS
jgi:hypothetical protein